MDDQERKRKLEEIFESDSLGLLANDQEKTSLHTTQEGRLIDSFSEISEFYENHQREPSFGDDIGEYRLASRLEAIKKDPQKVKILLPYDYYNLLKCEETKSLSVDDLIADDPLDLLGDQEETDDIFTMSHVKPSERIRPDYIARRKICKNFDEYEPMFERIHEELASGKRHMVSFKPEDLREGAFYALRGVLFFMETNSAELTEKTYAGELYRRKDGRTRCIFDNGTESTMLYRSLVKAMQHDGFSISEKNDELSSPTITDEDRQCGYIYVLRSLSRNPQIRQMRNLYKIGYCSSDVSTRIRNAVHEPTYLMSDVEIVLTVNCYNMEVPYLEDAIHSFFREVNVHFEVSDEKGVIHYPKEWFQAPISVIEEAIRIIVDRKAENYKYDPSVQMIIQLYS